MHFLLLFDSVIISSASLSSGPELFICALIFNLTILLHSKILNTHTHYLVFANVLLELLEVVWPLKLFFFFLNQKVKSLLVIIIPNTANILFIYHCCFSHFLSSNVIWMFKGNTFWSKWRLPTESPVYLSI